MADKKLIDTGINEMSNITGQRAVPTLAKKSISNFKLREGMPIGVKVTLRGVRMYEFLERLVAVTLPRVRDFRGINNKSFDGKGNYTLGITEQIIFPEIDIDKVSKITGLDITFVTSANTDKEARALLSHLGLPFKDEEQETKDQQQQEKAKIEKAVAEKAKRIAALAAKAKEEAQEKAKSEKGKQPTATTANEKGSEQIDESEQEKEEHKTIDN